MENLDIKKLDLERLAILWKASNANQELREIIENELEGRVQKNSEFSREYLFEISIIKKHALAISFIPTTEAFDSYGAYIVVNLIFSEQVTKEMLKNYSAIPPINTYGQITAKELVKGVEQMEELEFYSFHTNEILKVEFLS